jgi:hypothetical protein
MGHYVVSVQLSSYLLNKLIFLCTKVDNFFAVLIIENCQHTFIPQTALRSKMHTCSPQIN